MNCPICENTQYEQLLNLPCGNLDGSHLYDPVIVVACSLCGHVYNLVSEKDQAGMLKYYEDEYSLNNLGSPNTEGDIPGSSNAASIERYSLLYDFIKPYLNKSDSILDIGCATGGFLKYLKERDYKKLYGIDPSSAYVAEARKIEGLKISLDSAEAMLFESNTFDFLIADQVVEHLFDPNKIFIEATRVLKPGGYFCISVPDAARYYDNYFFDFYWFLMREHIQHFDFEHLFTLARKYGFTLRDIVGASSDMLSNVVKLPSLSMIFEYDNDGGTSIIKRMGLKSKITSYIDMCRVNDNSDFLMCRHYESKKQMYAWGIGREFLYLYTNGGLKGCNIRGLIDDTPAKQGRTFKGMKIMSSDIIKDLPEDSIIFIMAFAHKEMMMDKLKQMGYKGSVI